MGKLVHTVQELYQYNGLIFLPLFFSRFGASIVQELFLNKLWKAIECAVMRVHEELHDGSDLCPSALGVAD